MTHDHVIFWVNGRQIGTPLPDHGIGQPICMGCELPLDTGMVFRGNGAVCYKCISEFHNDLLQIMGEILSKSNT